MLLPLIFSYSFSPKGTTKLIDDITFSNKQLGKKWGKHKFDYTDLKSFPEYKNKAIDIFKNPQKIIHDVVEGEYYYVRGKNLLRISEAGDFISLYLGAESQKVIKAIKNGGTIWVQ